MNRRKFFGDLTGKILFAIGFAGALCQKALDAADSWFRWPNYPSTKALRNHLATSKNHREYGWSDVQGKSRSALIAMHDRSHFRSGGKAPLKKTTSNSSGSKRNESNTKPNKTTQPKYEKIDSVELVAADSGKVIISE